MGASMGAAMGQESPEALLAPDDAASRAVSSNSHPASSDSEEDERDDERERLAAVHNAFKEALRKHGPDHVAVGHALVAMGKAHSALDGQKYTKAGHGFLMRAVSLLEANPRAEFGLPHPQALLAEALVEASLVRDELGRRDLAQAQDMLSRALSIYEQRDGRDSAKAWETRAMLGMTCVEASNHAVGLSHLKNALAGLERIKGKSHPQVTAVLGNLVAAQGAARDRQQQSAMLERAMLAKEMTYSLGHPELPGQDAHKFDMKWSVTDLVASREQAEQSVRRLRDARGERSPEVAEAETQLGSILLRLGEAQAAAELLELALRTRDLLDEEDDEVALVLAYLAAAYGELWLRGRQTKALQRLLSIVETELGGSNTLTQRTKQALESITAEGAHDSKQDSQTADQAPKSVMDASPMVVPKTPRQVSGAGLEARGRQGSKDKAESGEKSDHFTSSTEAGAQDSDDDPDVGGGRAARSIKVPTIELGPDDLVNGKINGKLMTSPRVVSDRYKRRLEEPDDDVLHVPPPLVMLPEEIEAKRRLHDASDSDSDSGSDHEGLRAPPNTARLRAHFAPDVNTDFERVSVASTVATAIASKPQTKPGAAGGAFKEAGGDDSSSDSETTSSWASTASFGAHLSSTQQDDVFSHVSAVSFGDEHFGRRHLCLELDEIFGATTERHSPNGFSSNSAALLDFMEQEFLDDDLDEPSVRTRHWRAKASAARAHVPDLGLAKSSAPLPKPPPPPPVPRPQSVPRLDMQQVKPVQEVIHAEEQRSRRAIVAAANEKAAKERAKMRDVEPIDLAQRLQAMAARKVMDPQDENTDSSSQPPGDDDVSMENVPRRQLPSTPRQTRQARPAGSDDSTSTGGTSAASRQGTKKVGRPLKGMPSQLKRHGNFTIVPLTQEEEEPWLKCTLMGPASCRESRFG